MPKHCVSDYCKGNILLSFHDFIFVDINRLSVLSGPRFPKFDEPPQMRVESYYPLPLEKPNMCTYVRENEI